MTKLIDINKINGENFEEAALLAFQHQYQTNIVYKSYCNSVNKYAEKIDSVSQIPFLPISFFKSHPIVASGEWEPSMVFESSGTTASTPSRHFIKDLAVYEASFRRSFQLFYGSPNKYCILGLLPSYLERQHSSLVYMTKVLMGDSGHPKNDFFLHDFEKLHQVILALESAKQPTLLIGVSYALLDFSERFPMQLSSVQVIETGGMKGKRAELPRTELHRILINNFGLSHIHSEYGMTELLSQAYSKGNGIFNPPPQMKIVIREEDDPLSVSFKTDDTNGKTGAINIIDLANIHSCSFIATEDYGKLYPDGSFEIKGRIQDADIRGCGLMYGN